MLTAFSLCQPLTDKLLFYYSAWFKVLCRRNVRIIERTVTLVWTMMRDLIIKSQSESICAQNLSKAKFVFSSSSPESFLCAIVVLWLTRSAFVVKLLILPYALFYIPIVVARQLDKRRERPFSKILSDYITKEKWSGFMIIPQPFTFPSWKEKKSGVLVVDCTAGPVRRWCGIVTRTYFYNVWVCWCRWSISYHAKILVLLNYLRRWWGCPDPSASNTQFCCAENIKRRF